MGDGTNLVLILAGELLKVAEHLLIMGLHPSEITKGYEIACQKALEELESELSSCQTRISILQNRFRAIYVKTVHTLNSKISS